MAAYKEVIDGSSKEGFRRLTENRVKLKAVQILRQVDNVRHAGSMGADVQGGLKLTDKEQGHR